MHARWVALHPAALAMTACLGRRCTATSIPVTGRIPDIGSLPYLLRMRLFDFIPLESPRTIVEHDASGRFIPLTQITSTKQLAAFLNEMVPLLHANPSEVQAVKQVLSELVRNVFEHAGSSVGAILCAQYYRENNRVAIGVADSGMGILETMRAHHHVTTSKDAITLALRPGITGTTSRRGGTETNAGLGLFLTKCIARLSRNYFFVYSGDAMFKLLSGGRSATPQLFADPLKDPATWRTGLPWWQGTIIGIDLSIQDDREFQRLLDAIHAIYRGQMDASRKQTHKRPRFT